MRSKTRNNIDAQWGRLGLCDTDKGGGFFAAPEALFRYHQELGLTATDVFFILKVTFLQKNRTVPYPAKIGLDPKTVTAVKKRLLERNAMEDLTKRGPPDGHPKPQYSFKGLLHGLKDCLDGKFEEQSHNEGEADNDDDETQEEANV